MQRITEPDQIQLDFSRAFPSLVLASSSPNRRALLETGGAEVTTFTPDADETRDGKTPLETVLRIAERKLDAYLSSSSFNPALPAISCDTMVLIGGRLLGKPKDEEDAYSMLKELSGKRQSVISAAFLYLPERGKIAVPDEAGVIFRKLPESEIREYVSTNEWQGAAGGYRLQKTGYKLVESIDGDWTTVVGLPLKKILSLCT
ncbi:MAG: septum formation protein Maf [Spirochaetes bacterium]|uniref:Nucleoside triphosphate pyrophosphatase n=1 Tax=Candidatus Ornithospirochaeta stercoripullorum TaxID=2840899 RepID=A0A9D9H4X9_9SPIO|nr:septum formation protein Maf [Candidatus Ornithospirochaeta stercoripullorum]